MNILSRTVFETSRLQEFFTQKELQMQMGIGRQHWPLALAKELIDNALDACESAGVAPEIGVRIEPDALEVDDNGPGLPEETLKGSLDYMVRVSDKSYYVSPTRGQLGNALKCVWAAPYVVNGQHGRVEITTGQETYTIDVTLDRIAGEPRIKVERESNDVVKNGTFVKVYWPEIAGLLNSVRRPDFYDADRIQDIGQLITHYAMFNPHATFVVTGFNPQTKQRTLPDWEKWLPTNPISPHWYTMESLRGLIAAYLHRENEGGKAYTVREFVSEFAGLSGSIKQKRVTEQAGLAGVWLHDLVDGDDVDGLKVAALLTEMCNEARVIQPTKLGVIGEEHIRGRLVATHCVDENTFKYKKVCGETDGLPFVVEAAFGCYRAEYAECGRDLIVGLNWTPALKMPFDELNQILDSNQVDHYDPVAVVVHLACPRLDFTDRGKSTLDLPFSTKQALEKALSSVTKAFAAEKRKLRRDERLRERQREKLSQSLTRPEYTIIEAAYEVMEEAYREASYTEQYGYLPVAARQIMYKARPKVLELTDGKCWSKSGYFTQTIVPNFLKDNPELTTDWDVIFDARGHLIEPHTANTIPLGGKEVRRYIASWQFDHKFDEVPQTPKAFGGISTSGPGYRFNYVLFIEKEGWNELFRQVDLAERFDIAIMSTKGMSNTAARQLVEEFSKQGVTTFVLHDLDKWGLGILHTLRTDTRRYEFSSRPLVVDLGLRLDDVEEMGLEKERVEYKNVKKDSRIKLREYGATKEERDMLVQRQTSYNRWEGQRVELNAMSNDQLLKYIERKLEEAGVEKVMPDEELLKKVYRRAVKAQKLQKAIDKAVSKFKHDEVNVPQDLAEQVKKSIEGEATSWDAAICELASID